MPRKSVTQKIKEARHRIIAGDRGGSFEFGSSKKLREYIGIDNQDLYNNEEKIKNAEFVFFKKTHLEDKIADAKERIGKGDRGGSFKFTLLGELCKYIGISQNGFRVNKEKIMREGFILSEQTSVKDRILDAKKRIEKGDRDGNFKFASAKELYEYIGISNTALRANKEKIAGTEFVFRRLTKHAPVEDKIADAKERIEKGDRDGSFEFASIKELYTYIGISESSYFAKRDEIKNTGFIFPEAILVKNRIADAKEKIEKGDRGGSFEFAMIKELCEYIDISNHGLYSHEKKIKNAGFIFHERVPFEEKISDAKERIEKGDRDGSFEFATAHELCKYIGTSILTLDKYKEKINNAGFVFSKTMSVEDRIADAKERIEKGERSGNFKFAMVKELCEYIGITDQTLGANKEKVTRAGFTLLKKEISKNIIFAIESCKHYGIKLENGQLLPSVAREFFSRHIRPLENENDYKSISMDIVHDYSPKEKEKVVKEAVFRLMSEDRGDYSILELKLELFMSNVYLSEDSILEALIHLGEDINREDSIAKRLRLSAAFVSHGLIEIEYVDELPAINNSIDGNIILDKRILNKKTFMKLWREYALFSIKNKITGSVSKSKIPDDWDGRLDTLFAIIPAYERAYLLDSESIWFLEEVGYEGILAICQYGSKQSKSMLTRMHHAIHARCIGFFLFLNRKKYALLQPKYIIFTGAHSVSDTAKIIMDSHVVMNGFRQVLKTDDVSRSDLKKLSQKNVDLQALKFSGSIREGCDLSAIHSKDIYAYLQHSSHEAISGTIIHETLVLILLRNLGNLGAIEKPKEFDFGKEVLNLKHSSGIQLETLRSYKKLLSEMTDVVRKEFENGKSNDYIKQYLNQIFALMKFLDTFPGKLNRKEMSAVLNTVIVSDAKKSFKQWAKKNLTDFQYADFTSKMFVLFDNIALEEYKGLYSRGWKVTNKFKTRSLIREGMNAEVFSVLQHVALYDPPRADEYPFPKTTPEGEQLDLSWWPFDFSPVPVVCNWLITKTTRRKASVRHLDVNTFLRFDEEKNLTHMHFNTDKNRESKESDIEIYLLKYIFTPEELEFIKNYVDYIKNAYSSMTPVSYESSSKYFGKIMPLFPHHTMNAVIADPWVDGYHIKTMLKTEMILRLKAKDGAFDSFIEEQDRERRKEDLAKTRLVFNKPSSIKELPKDIEELEEISIASYRSHFTTKTGIHNMRHAGISSLGAQLPLVYVRIIAGHMDINTTARIYLHANEELIGLEISANLNEPIGSASKFIRTSIMPFIESGEPEKIEKILLDNHFMSASREIHDGSEKKMIEDGVARASSLHPSLWIPEKYGVCTNNQQCPAGTNGCCGLCPFNIFSPMHIKGVIYVLNACLESVSLISQKIALDSRRGVNASREEMKSAHQQKILEMAAWFGVLDMIYEKINGLGWGNTENLPDTVVEHLKKGLYSMGSCTLKEALMELLVDARELLVDDLDNDNRIAKMSHNLLQAAIHRKDYGALDRMANEGIQYIVDAYGEKALKERKEYLLQQLKSGDLAEKLVELGASSADMALLSV